MQQPPAGYKAPQVAEVYILSDHANATIPHEIREQFQRDEKGRVLFFSAPPLNVGQPLNKDGRALGHSARYLAAKAKKDATKAAKRKADEANVDEREAIAKKAKTDEEDKFKAAVSALNAKAIKALEDQLAMTTKAELASTFNGRTKESLAHIIDYLTEAQKVTIRQHLEREVHDREREAKERISVTGMTAVLEERI